MGKRVEKLLLFRFFKKLQLSADAACLMTFFFLAGLSMGTHVHRCQLTPWKNLNEPRASWVQPETPSLFARRTSIPGGSRLAHNPISAIDLNSGRYVSIGGTVYHLPAI